VDIVNRQKIETLQHTIKAFIRKGETHYGAECLDIPVVTQGQTNDETVDNLKEAVSLHLEDEDLSEFGLAPNPTLIITMEVEPLANVA
jgi:predicted RNase H-like HicB family nuclease